MGALDREFTVSVLVVSYCTRDLTLACLESLYSQPQGVSFEVVVVDNASTDRSARAIADAYPQVRLIALDENIGFGRACNIGVAGATRPALALVNPDVELIDDSLLAVAAEVLRDDRPVRLLAPRVLNPDGSVQDTAQPLPGSAVDLIRALVPPALVPGRAGQALAPWRTGRPREIGWAVGCALVGQTATLTEWEAFVRNQRRVQGPAFAPPKLVCIDLQPYGTAQAPDREDILNVGGFSDAVFHVVAGFLANDANRFVTEVEAVAV